MRIADLNLRITFQKMSVVTDKSHEHLQGFFLLLCDSIRFRKRDHGSGCYHTEGDNRLYRPLVQGA